MPSRSQNTSRRAAGAPRLIAHRGGSGLVLENTLAAFENAINAGCDGAELDVHLSADGEPMVHHDAALDHRTTRSPDGRWLAPDTAPRIGQLTRAEIQRYRLVGPAPDSDYAARFPDLRAIGEQRIPTLAEVVDLVTARSAHFTLVVEIKSACLFDPDGRDWRPLVDAVVPILARPQLVGRIVLCGFDWRALRYARALLPRPRLWLNTHPLDWLGYADAPRSDLVPGPAFRAALRRANAAGAPWYDGFRPDTAAEAGRMAAAAGGDLWFGYYTDCSARAIAGARRAGVGIGAWTVNLRHTRARTALQKRDLDAVCLDYF